MARETDAFVAAIEWIGRQVLAELDGLSDEMLNRPMPMPEANSLYAVATHLAGALETWTLRYCAGRTVVRDREAEFRATGTGAGLRNRYTRLLADVREALDALPEGALDRPGDPGAGSQFPGRSHLVRDSLVHAVDHAALHLGHIQITKQLLTQGSSGA